MEERPPGAGSPEEPFRDPDPPPKGAGAAREEVLPGGDPPRTVTFTSSAADPPFVEDRPPGAYNLEGPFRDPDPPTSGHNLKLMEKP